MPPEAKKPAAAEPAKKVVPQPMQQKFLENNADICVYGGAAGGGKSWAILLEPLYHVRNSGFNAVIFRRTFPQISQPGGLWDQSGKVYPDFEATPNMTDTKWKFPSGATVRFAHLQYDKNVFDWMGSEITLIGFDELTHFSEEQFWYLLSRNRSTCGIKPYVRASCNPDADSWVAKLLEWWIDQDTGFPIPERACKKRYFVRLNDKLEWADTFDELKERFPDSMPKSLSFVPAKLSDNRKLMDQDPGYLGNLLALPLVEKERLLNGNWKIRPTSGLIFNRSWFKIVPSSPRLARRVRAWDKASTPGAGDWTAGVLMSLDDDGVYYVEHVIRGQWSPAERNRVIQQTAMMDGTDIEIWLEQEAASSGKESAQISIRELAGFVVHAEPVSGDKVTRARQFSAQVEGGNVRLLEAEWNMDYLDELHGFPKAAHDDQVDASSMAFNKLANAFRGSWDPYVTPGIDDRSYLSRMPKSLLVIEDKRTDVSEYGEISMDDDDDPEEHGRSIRVFLDDLW
jgi:hypothetical protein